MKTMPGKSYSKEHSFKLVSPPVKVQTNGCFIIEYLPMNAKLFKLEAGIKFESNTYKKVIEKSGNLAIQYNRLK